MMYQVEDTHFWFKGMRAILESLLSTLSLPPRAKILDAGCGTGINLGFLQQFGQVTGLDYSPHAVHFASDRGFNVQQGSINALPYRANSFDLITCHNVIDEASVNDQTALAEFHRVLKPGGYLLVLVPAYQWLLSSHDFYFGTARRYTTNSLTKIVRRQHLHPIRSTYANTLLFPIEAVKRLSRKYFPFLYPKLESDVTPVPPLLNFLLYLPLLLESFWLKYFNFPFGLSVFVIARKNATVKS
jgi:ubiquinone/menaquinone biosynthesis C-methylase UbiE